MGKTANASMIFLRNMKPTDMFLSHLLLYRLYRIYSIELTEVNRVFTLLDLIAWHLKLEEPANSYTLTPIQIQSRDVLGSIFDRQKGLMTA